MRDNLHVKITRFDKINPKYVGERLKEGIENKDIVNDFQVYYFTDKCNFGNFLCSTPDSIFFKVPIENTRLIYIT